MLVLALAGTTFQQLLFFKQGGNPNAVYFSLISIVFALFIAYGFSLFPRWWAAALSIWLALRGFAFALRYTFAGRSLLKALWQALRNIGYGSPLQASSQYVSALS